MADPISRDEEERDSAARLQERLKELRKAHGELSRPQLAQRSGLSADTIENMETKCGPHGPGVFNLMRIADAYGISLDALVGRGGVGLPAGMALIDLDVITELRSADDYKRIEHLLDHRPAPRINIGLVIPQNGDIVSREEFLRTVQDLTERLLSLSAKLRRREGSG